MMQLKTGSKVFEQLKKFLMKYSTVINIGIALLSMLCGFIVLENSSRGKLLSVLDMELIYVALNIMTLGTLWVVILILCNRMWLSSLLLANISGIIAIINYYVTMYHGMPLSFLVLRNFATAMAVATSYSFAIDKEVWQILAAVLVMSAVCVFFRIVLPEKKCVGTRRWMRSLLLTAASVVVILVGYTGEHPIKPAQTMSWLWSEAYHTYGYVACTIESISKPKNPVVKPENYSVEAVGEIEIKSANNGTATPDVILILNETFYDLRQAATFTTDIPYMQNIESMENLQRGYAVVPMEGGGTNSAEYELLTSNSMQLMPGVTPFNTLDLYGANSIISHLNRLGYDTTGSHPEPSANYLRGLGYRALGFQNAYFDDDFQQKEQYGDRYFVTDQSIYQSLIRWYEASPEDTPRFQYLLTIQNHGDWNMNAPEYDIVHVQEDFGKYTDTMNEFLSCIYLTDQAFKELTDYFSEVDRPVIICMVGDHCPPLASNIVDVAYSDAEKHLQLRKVPLLIWANFELEQVDLGTMSMNYVVPTLLDLAKIPTNPYYRYMLQSQEQVPILTAYGDYYDAMGNLYKYKDTESPYKQLVEDYFKLEYYNIENPAGSLLSD